MSLKIGITAMAISSLLYGCASNPTAKTETRPNIILVMADDQGWGDVAYNGNTLVKTPHLDKMAREGIRLDRFYAAAPVCSPTRASCLTGRHPCRYNIPWAGDGHLPSEETTLAEALKTAGYATGHFGKWHVGGLSKGIKQSYFIGGPSPYSPPWENGFDECFTCESMMPTYNPYYHDCGEFSIREGDNPYVHVMNKPVEFGDMSGTPWRDHYWTGPGQVCDEVLAGDTSEIIMSRALTFIEKQAQQKTPFFSCVWFNTPHSPIVAGNEMRAIYEDLTREQLIEITGFEGEMTDEIFTNMKMEAQHWFGCLTAMDLQVGRLRSELRRMGIADNTIVWYCSDNGPSYIHDYNSAGGLSGKKATLLEGGVRVPGIVEWPAQLKGGRTIEIPMVTSDFYPTFLNVTGVTMKDQPTLDGINVMPILDGTVTERPAPIGFQAPNMSTKNVFAEKGSLQMTWHDNAYKLVSYDGGKRWMLFDLEKDSAEQTDIVKQHPDRVKKMQADLAVWRESCSESAQGKDY